MHLALIAMFRKRERNLLYGGVVQYETAELAKLIATMLDTILREALHDKSPRFLAYFF
jgi:hypothetical protein